VRRVFISHSTSDRPTVELIVEHLIAHGLDVWISDRNIDGQSEYSEQIERAIRDCIAVVVVISRASNSSPEVLKEVELRLKAHRAILPVVMHLPLYVFCGRHLLVAKLGQGLGQAVSAGAMGLIPTLSMVASSPSNATWQSWAEPAQANPSCYRDRAKLHQAGQGGVECVSQAPQGDAVCRGVGLIISDACPGPAERRRRRCRSAPQQRKTVDTTLLAGTLKWLVHRRGV
jgi:hypothetical protein